MRGDQKISDLQAKLAISQTNFHLAVSVETVNGVERLLESHRKMNESLRKVIEEIRAAHAESARNHAKTHEQVTQLQNATSVANDTTHLRLDNMQRDQRVSQQAADSTRTAVDENFAKLETGTDKQLVNIEIAATRAALIGSLKYDGMFDRQQFIKTPLSGTFEWIFDDSPPRVPQQDEDPRSREHMRGKFARWLRSNEPLFWISGKAGSGKSSLMSLIKDDPRTNRALSTWAEGQKVYTFSFFFWRAGSALQNGIPGLLRSLLHQLVEANSDVVDLIMLVKPALYNGWTTQSLLDALQKSLEAFQKDRIFLMIDGLDEYEDEYTVLLGTITMFRDRSNVKTCVASRPETVILAELCTFPTLRLQDLNRRDISKFVRRKLQPCEGNLTEEFMCRFVDRAEGVFLWAALVVNSMVSGFLSGDDEATLPLQLDNTPKELFDLFKQLLFAVDKVHQDSLSLCLFHLKQAHQKRYHGFPLVGTIGLIAASLPKCEEVCSTDQFLSLCAQTSDRLVAHMKGSIEIDRPYMKRRFENSAIELLDFDRHTHERKKIDLHNDRYAAGERMIFCHRSAHNFFFGPESSAVHSDAPWLMPALETERIARMTLNGLVVFLQHAPLIISPDSWSVTDCWPFWSPL
jgi:hypothetical protein